MFLMNAPPVVPLQSRWEAFGPPGSFRFPGCFSESGEDVARASVSTRVQMIISSLPRDEPALGMSHGRAAQRGPPAERCRDARLAASPAVHKEQPVFAACGLAADGDPLGQEDSDSDDSVDRGIEEAIQEYLRAKSGAPQPSPPKPPHRSALPTLGPPTLAPGSASAPGSSVGTSKDQGFASPGSVSSEDSFEQSIQAEIEQFLHEKRQHGIQKCAAGPVDVKSDLSEHAAARLKSCREPPRMGSRQDLTGACKEFVFRRHPGLVKGNTQHGSFQPEPEAVQPRGRARRNTSASGTPRGRRLRRMALVPRASDSSSDDGIEEAIQLYQLEKTRKEASGDPLPRAQLQEKGPDAPASGAGGTLQSPVLEPPRRALSKKKPAAPKATGPPGSLDSSHPSKFPRDTRARAPPGHPAGRSESAEPASSQAEASAELMCAEAILDISKTILPAPGESADPPVPRATLARSGGDSSAVDSDDSIEQEIRTFLALKAQHPLSPPAPSAQAGLPKTPLPKPPEQPMGSKRKRRGGGSCALRPTTPKKTRDPRDSTQNYSHSQTRTGPGCDAQDSVSQAKASKAPAEQGEAQSQCGPSRRAGLSDTRGSPGFGTQTRNTDKGGSVREKESSEDKSSSLDSDEDLDTAIKDLLRSKQKFKKRYRDPQSVGKKKVRFSTTETRVVDKLCGLPGEWAGQSPQVLRSCLSRSRGHGRVGPRRPRVFSSTAQRTETGSSEDQTVALAFQARRIPQGTVPSWDLGAGHHPPSVPSPSSLSEDSSVDSDDSIELEIRKFLAEKAKECVGRESQAGSRTAFGSGGQARPEVLCRRELALQPGIRTWSQRATGGPQLTEGGWGTERAGAEGAASLCVQGEKGARLLAAPGRCEAAALPRVGSGSKRNTCAHRDQSPRGAEPATAESAFGQLSSCAKMTTEAAGPGGTFQLDYGSQNLLAPSPGLQADLTLPWSDFAHQNRLSSPWTLSTEGRGSSWTGGPGCLRGKETEGPASGPRRSLPFSSFPPWLSTHMFPFGKSISWGDSQAGHFSPLLGLPLQGPAFSGFRETQASHSPVFGSPHLKNSRSRANRAQREGMLDPRYRQQVGDGDQQEPEVLGSDASEFSDTSMEDTGDNSAVKGKVLTS